MARLDFLPPIVKKTGSDSTKPMSDSKSATSNWVKGILTYRNHFGCFDDPDDPHHTPAVAAFRRGAGGTAASPGMRLAPFLPSPHCDF